MNAVLILLLVVTLANFALAAFVFWHDPKAEANCVFGITAFSTGLWTVTNAVFLATNSLHVATVAAQFSYLAALSLAASLVHFSLVFPVRRQIGIPVKALFWVLALGIGLLSFVPGFIIRTVQLSPTRSIETTGGLYILAAYLGLTLIATFAGLLFRHFSLNRFYREQSRYLIIGLTFATVFGVMFNLLLPLRHDYRFVGLGPAASSVFVAFTIYAIIAHQLFDIRFVIKKTLVYSALIAAVGAGYALIEHSLTEFLEQAAQNTNFAWLANIAGALVVALLFTPLKTWLEKQVGNLIYRDKKRRKALH